MSKFLNILTSSQNNKQWESLRKSIISATDISSILESNPFKSKRELLIEKSYKNADNDFTNSNFYNLDAVNWGHKFEPIAKDIYQNMNKCNVITSGLIGHNRHKWLAATPDGFVLKNNVKYKSTENVENIKINDINKLIEFKCPFNRDIFDTVPIYYWMQTQLQMEVCNINTCDLFVCKFLEYDNIDNYNADIYSVKGTFFNPNDNKQVYWKLHNYKIFTIKRDRKWFSNNFKALENFYNEMIYYQSEDHIEELLSIGKKRKRVIIDDKNAKKQKLSPIIHPEAQNEEFNISTNTDFTNFVCPSDLRNYFIDEPLLDYLKYYGYKNHSIINDPKNSELGFFEYITQKGVEFEKHTIEKLIENININNENVCKSKIGGRKYNYVIIANDNYGLNNKKYQETINAFKNGVDIIIHGVLIDYQNKFRGVPDLLVRSDIVNEFFGQDIYPSYLCKVKNTLNNKKYHYVPIEIKYASLQYLTDGQSLGNSANFMYYKAQVYLYGVMLSNILGVEMNYGLIIGRKYKYVNNKITYKGDKLFEKLGLIDFTNIKLTEKVQKAINWVVDLKNNGKDWKFFDKKYFSNYLNKSNINNTKNCNIQDLYNDIKDIKPELFPNMNNKNDHPYHNFKKVLSSNIGEITSLWNVSLEDRNNCIKKGIFSYYDNNISVDNFKLSSSAGRKKILQGFLDVNKSSFTGKYLYTKDDLKILKKNIFTKEQDKSESVDFYVDFETTTDLVDENDGGKMKIFLIGMGYKDPTTNNWVFKKYNVNYIDDNEVRRILIEWIDNMKSICHYYNGINSKPNIYHWAHAEKTWYNKSFYDLSLPIKYHPSTMNWIDICDGLRKNPIFIKDSYSFGLKNYAKALYNNGLITTKWEDNNIDGLGAMVCALNANKKAIEMDISLDMIPVMNEIIRYNEVDCKVLMEICDFIKKL